MSTRRITPTLAICVAGAAVAGGLLALPPAEEARPATPSAAVTVAPGAPPPSPIAIADFSFGEPRTVPPGGVVLVSNADAEPHTLTAEDGAFDSGTVDGGSEVTFTAPAVPGTYDVYCGIHPSMTGQLVVD